MRVYELALELSTDCKTILKILEELGIKNKVPQSNLNHYEVREIKKSIPEQNFRFRAIPSDEDLHISSGTEAIAESMDDGIFERS